MTPPATLQPAVQPTPVATQPTRYRGAVVYVYAFDVAYEMLRTPIPTLLGQPVAQFAVDASKRSPRQVFFYRAHTVRMPPLERFGHAGILRIERSIKILPVGAISITVRIPFEVEHLTDLVEYHDLRFSNGGSLYDDVRELADEVRRELAPHSVRPVIKLGDEEAYTVFCLNAPLPPDGSGKTQRTEDWLHAHRREVAALLTEEPDVDRLSEQEATDSTGKYFSYYDKDLVVMDWDAALIVDEPRYHDETLYIMELANLQLAELEAYDRLLDDAVDRAYRDLVPRAFSRRTGPRVQRELREIRVDLARLSDELSNITKFFGDWHLARIYQGLSARFHLSDWHRTIDEKLKTLDDLYQLLQSERNNRWMLTLEVTVVLLFVIDLIILFFGGKH